MILESVISDSLRNSSSTSPMSTADNDLLCKNLQEKARLSSDI